MKSKLLFVAALAALVSFVGCDSQPIKTFETTTIESAPANSCEKSQDCKDDGNPCTVAVCEDLDGTKVCGHKAKDNGTACIDADICSVQEICLQGKCLGVLGKCKDDGNPCTSDSCTPGKGCLYVPIVGACEDGDVCTSNDTCNAGKCQSGADVCECKADSDCDNDDNLCNGEQVCESNKCVVAKGSVVTCSDEDPCNVVACEPTTGKCESSVDKTALGQPCADNAVCTLLDSGYPGFGKCEVAKVTECSTDKQCDDGKVFTDNTCNKEGKCEFTLNTADCDDGNVCTENDAYKNGVCIGELKSCNDNSPCTTDICDPAKGCLHTAAPKGTKCEDGDVYTYNICEAGKCVNTECDADWQCDDKEYCTKDECTYGKCTHINLAKYACDDGDACTTDYGCVDGSCNTVAKSCDDGNANTADSCNPKTGACIHTPVFTPQCVKHSDCNDGNACTTDTCVGGSCKTFHKDCNDGNANTADSCNATTGKCVNTPVGNTGTVTVQVATGTSAEVYAWWGNQSLHKKAETNSMATFTMSKVEACKADVHINVETFTSSNKWWGCNPGTPKLSSLVIMVNGKTIPTVTKLMPQACGGGGDGNVVVTKKQLGCF